MVAGHGDERGRGALMRKGVEFVDILEEKIFLGIWWKERRKEKGKKKENEGGRYFLNFGK